MGGVRILRCVLDEVVWQRADPPQFMGFGPVDLLLHVLVKWVDDAGCNISQGVIHFSGVWNSLLALNVDELVRVDLQTGQLQLLFVAFNAETGKCEQRLMLQQLV